MARREIQIETGDGVAKAGLFGAGAKAGILLYMDIFGPRPALDAMAGRFVDFGYAVLVPDIFYRVAPYGPFDPKKAWGDPTTAAWLRSTVAATTQAMTQADTRHFLAAFDAAGVTGPVGTVGYCMGGSRALNAAAGYPDRIKAAASFHGGNLASDAEDSPHRSAAAIKAKVYVGSAGVDTSFPPEQSAKLASALRVAEVDHVIENYVGVGHGWCVPDHSAYDETGAERHWRRLGTFFSEALSA